MTERKTATTSSYPIVLFDADCALCNRSVRFIMKRERDQQLRFASLRSPLGRQLATQAGLNPDQLVGRKGSLLYITPNNTPSTRSNAAISIAKHLKPPWNALTAARYIPGPIRDAIYTTIAANRHRLFKQDTASNCKLPTDQQRHRFLDLT